MEKEVEWHKGVTEKAKEKKRERPRGSERQLEDEEHKKRIRGCGGQRDARKEGRTGKREERKQRKGERVWQTQGNPKQRSEQERKRWKRGKRDKKRQGQKKEWRK